MRVLNYGSLNYDYVYQVDHILVGGETLDSLSMEMHLGGKGLNQSIALAKAGIPVYHAGTIGEDGQAFLDCCNKYGVNTEFIRQIPGKSGHTIIQVDKQAQNCIMLFGGSNHKQTKEQINEVISHFEKGDILLLQNEVNYLDYIIETAFAKGMVIVLNPSPYNSALEKCDLSKISCFLLNEIEGEQMTGEKEGNAILDCLLKKYPDAKVVLTLGVSGSYYQEGKKRIHQPIYKVKAVDTTAAGDTFTGYFISGAVRGEAIEQVLERCAKASAITVSREGAADSIPTLGEVESLSFFV